MDKKSVLIVFVNYKRTKEILDCVSSLKKTNYSNYSICIVDNNSEKKQISKLKKLKNIKLILNRSNRGFAGGNNDALKKFNQFDYYLLLNGDTKIIEKNWLLKLVNYSEKNINCGIIAPQLLNKDLTVQHCGGYNTFRGTKLIFSNTTSAVDWVSGAAFLIKKEVIQKIGYLNEIYNPAQYEEADYCHRAKQAGFKIIYYPLSKIVHYNDGKLSNEIKTITQRNKLIFILIHFPIRWLFLRFFIEVFVFFREFFREKKIPIQYGFILKNFLYILKLRNKLYISK